MPIRFDCVSCGKHYRVKHEAAGKQFECRECGETLRVPIPEADTDEPMFDPYAETQTEQVGGHRPPRVRVKTKARERRKEKPSSSGRPAWLWGGSAVGLVLVTVIAVVVWRSSRPQGAQEPLDAAELAGGDTGAAASNQTENPPRDVTAGKTQDTAAKSPAALPPAYRAIFTGRPLYVVTQLTPTRGFPGQFTPQVTTLIALNSLFAFSPDGKRVLTQTELSPNGSSLQISDAATGTAVGMPLRAVGTDRYFYAVSFSPNGETVLTGSGEMVKPIGEAQLFSAKTGAPLGGPLPHDGRVSAVAFSPDGQTFLTGTGKDIHQAVKGRYKGETQLWDTRTRKRIGPPLRQGGIVTTAAFSPDGKTVLTASTMDVVARLWDAETGKSVGGAMRHETGVMDARFSPDGRVVATAAGYDKTARLWDAATGSAIGKPLEHERAVVFIAFSPDSRRLVTGSYDETFRETFRLWDVTTQVPIGGALPHAALPTIAAFSPDGKLLATASEDRAVRLWNGETGERLEFPFEKSPEYGGSFVTFSPDGKSLLTGVAAPSLTRGWDGFIRVWDLAELPGNDSIRRKQ